MTPLTPERIRASRTTQIARARPRVTSQISVAISRFDSRLMLGNVATATDTPPPLWTMRRATVRRRIGSTAKSQCPRLTNDYYLHSPHNAEQHLSSKYLWPSQA